MQGVACLRRFESEKEVGAGCRFGWGEPQKRARGFISGDDQVRGAGLFGNRIRRGAPELAAGLRCNALKCIGQPRGADAGIGEPPGLEPAIAGVDLDAIEAGDLLIGRGDHLGIGGLQPPLERIADD